VPQIASIITFDNIYRSNFKDLVNHKSEFFKHFKS
jgi:hypothetical protein